MPTYQEVAEAIKKQKNGRAPEEDSGANKIQRSRDMENNAQYHMQNMERRTDA